MCKPHAQNGEFRVRLVVRARTSLLKNSITTSNTIANIAWCRANIQEKVCSYVLDEHALSCFSW
jgi:hypothetical protein